MNTYLVQYSREGEWIPFQILSDSIYEVEEWFKANVQEKGVCITYIDNCGPIQEEETFGMWSERAYEQRRYHAAVRQAIFNKRNAA